LQFDINATDDPTAYLCAADAIRYLGSLLPGGWKELMDRNHQMALIARRRLCAKLGIQPPAPDEMLGSMAAIPLKESFKAAPVYSAAIDPLQGRLFDSFKIEVPVWAWPAAPKRLFRVSAHLYNQLEQYDHLADALAQCEEAPQA
jgi:isopenicillin-N epimerase